MKNIITAALIALTVLATGCGRGALYITDNGALDGYDAVALLEDGQARTGVETLAVDLDGQTWLFETAENKDAFEADPEAYVPAYGGWCAIAMGVGLKIKSDPETVMLVDDTVYLFANHDARADFEADLDASIAKADARWAKKIDAVE